MNGPIEETHAAQLRTRGSPQELPDRRRLSPPRRPPLNRDTSNRHLHSVEFCPSPDAAPSVVEFAQGLVPIADRDNPKAVVEPGITAQHHLWNQIAGSTRDCPDKSDSTQNPMDHPAVNVSQPEIPSLVTIGKPFVVHAEQMKHGGVQIMHVERIDDRLVS